MEIRPALRVVKFAMTGNQVDAISGATRTSTAVEQIINQGIVNIIVGFAPLKPAEFVMIKIQQLAGQVET